MEQENQQKNKEMEEAEMAVVVVVELNDLPENCISSILALTSPRDACRSSVVSPIFRSASESDELWEKFLPSDYHEILSKSSSSPAGFPSSKKELYFRLSDNPILIDGGKKSFQIEKGTGKKCFMIGARELAIAWGDNPLLYWEWLVVTGSRFAEVAVLNSVWWLEIRGKIETRILSRKTTYAAYLVFDTENPGGLDFDASDASVEFVGGGGGECSGVRAVYFALDGSMRKNQVESDHPRWAWQQLPSLVSEARFSVERGDGWMEMELGDFFNDEGEDGEVEMSLMEIKGGCSKSGLIVQGIEVRPKGTNLVNRTN